MRRSANSMVRSLIGGSTVVLVAVAATLIGASPASAAPLSMTVTRGSSGGTTNTLMNPSQNPADTVGSLPASCSGITQGQPTPDVHCPGYDTSVAATDQILRTYDTAEIVFSFNVGTSDTGVKIVSTIPSDGSGNPLGVWTAVPSACASTGSSLNANKTTLTCVIGSINGDGVLKANLWLMPAALDGTTFTVGGTITSDGSPTGATAGSGATFTASSAPMYDVDLSSATGAWLNTLPQPFPYYSATRQLGWAVPMGIIVRPDAAHRVGSQAPLQGPVTLDVDLSGAPTGAQLLTWAEYGGGCAWHAKASSSPVAPYTNKAVVMSNQLAAPPGSVSCAEPGGANQPIHLTWTDPPVAPTSYPPGPSNYMITLSAWVMIWIPASSLPAGANSVPLTISGFDPSSTTGASNYGTGTESTANNTVTKTITSADASSGIKSVASDQWTNQGPTNGVTVISTIDRNSTFQSWLRFRNTGSVPQDPVQLCDVFDPTVAKLTAFPDSSWAVGVTTGDPSLPALPPPYDPIAGYNGTTDARIDPAGFTVQFAAGDTDVSGGVTNAPQSAGSLSGSQCDDIGGATGWHNSPTDPAIAAYATSLGLSDPLDAVNRVRITFTAGAVMPGSEAGAKLRFTARSTYRDASSKAGQLILATTPVSDIESFGYPQETAGSWSATAKPNPALKISGTLGSNVRILSKTSSLSTVQIATPGQDTTTYTITPTLYLGEDMPADPAIPGNVTAPLRVVDLLPTGMNYLQGSASIPPDLVQAQPDGTLLVWDLGTQSAKVNTANQPASPATISYKAVADPNAALGTNFNGAVAQSYTPTGTSLNPLTLCGGDSNAINEQVTIPATPNVGVATTFWFPKPGTDYSGCLSQGTQGPYNQAKVQIGSAAVQLSGGEKATAPQIEPNAVDGVAGQKVGWTLSYTNKTAITLDGVDIIDVIPYAGDTRTPPSSFSGTIGLKSISSDEAASATPNALPTAANGPYPARSGVTYYYAVAAGTSIKNDPYDPTNLAGGSTKWCLSTQFGTAGCPANIGAATAVRIIGGALAPAASHTLQLGFTTAGNKTGDVYSNNAYGRAINVSSLSYLPGDSMQVAGSSIAGTVWNDVNGDGTVAAAGTEAGLGGVTLHLTGTADDGSAVSLTTTTTADGGYTFGSLRAGSYDVTVDQASVRSLNAGYAITADPQHGTTNPTGTFHVDLAVGGKALNQNVGFATSSLSGTVFDDADNDGALDAGENGETGATVTLTGTDDLGAAVSRSTTTNASGVFTFGSLRPGNYSLTVAPNPASRLPGKITVGTAGGTGAVASNAVTGIALGTAANAAGYFFGELLPHTVGAAVFADANGNGVRDAGEAGIAGVTVTLTGTDDRGAITPKTATTLADGSVTFTGLREGTYILTEDQSTVPGGPLAYVDGVTSTGGGVGSAGTNQVTGITTASGDPLDSYTFAEVPAASLSGAVYDDRNGNGQRDAGEPGIPGVTVSLSGGAGTGTTNANGDYVFGGLAPGTYTVTETQPAGYLDGRDTAGTVGGTADNTQAGRDSIAGVGLTPGTNAAGYLFGEVTAASLSGSVYVDANGDGVRGAGEAGILGVTVTLTGTDLFGNAVTAATQQTGAGGAYAFAGLAPGTYAVTETQPAGYFDGVDAAGTSGGVVGPDTITAIPVAPGAAATGYTFGERAPVSLSGAVFSDLDGDGAIGAGEPGVSGATVDLLDAGGAVVDTITTTASGTFSFTGLAPGVYSLRKTLPAGAHYSDGIVTAGTAGGTPATSEIDGIDLVNGAASGYLFAEIALSAIRGTVWHDANDNGVMDAGEQPIAGVTVTLSGDADRTATTGANGAFTFADLDPGTYTIVETQPGNWADGRTVAGPAGGTVSSDTVSGIILAADTDASGYGFAERAAQLQVFVSAQGVAADAAPGPNVMAGSPVAFTYRVVNNGDTSLDSVTVTDGALAVDCPPGPLAPHASVDCDATTTAVPGAQSRDVSATATVVPDAGPNGVTAAAVTQATATTVGHYFGMIVTATISATVGGKGAEQAPGPVFPNGASEKVLVTITNTGNVPLTLSSIETGALGALDCGAATPIPPGGSLVCATTKVFPAGNWSADVLAHLAGPDGYRADGTTAPSVVDPATAVWFQVLEPDDVPPALASTGSDASGLLLGSGVLLLLGGGIMLVVWRKRRPDLIPPRG